jgi:branched-subunit amino acid ABC-type transport system permease component
MTSDTITSPQSRPLVNPVAQTFGQRLRTSWLFRYLLFPLGQMIAFIAGTAILLTLLAYLIALIFPEPRPNIILADQITKQLPGMIISGISIGFVYSMVALGYTLVYGVLKFINFAHSEIFMVGSVVGFEVMQAIAAGGAIQSWNPALLVITIVLAAMLFSGVLAMVIERVAYRPLRGAPRLVPLITAIGISFVLIDTTRALMAVTRNDFNLTYPTRELQWITTPIPVIFNGVSVGGINIGGRVYETITADGEEQESFNLGETTYQSYTVGGVTIGGTNLDLRQFRIGEEEPTEIQIAGQPAADLIRAGNVVNIRVTSIIIVVGSVLMLLALNYFVNGTKLGRGIRAVAQDQTTAGLMGVNVNRIISLTFFLGGAFGGAAGALFGMNVGTVTPYVGFIPGLKAFTAAVLGGIGNITGALLGGLTLGMIESFLNGTLVYFPALGQRYTDIFAFSVLILILIFRPSGLLGERVDEKV